MATVSKFKALKEGIDSRFDLVTSKLREYGFLHSVT